MKVLIDEQLPVKLKYRFQDAPREIYTVKDMGWLGRKNGELLQLMLDRKIEVLLTNDHNMYYQQRIEKYGVSIININTKTNDYDDVAATIGNIKACLLQIMERTKDNISSSEKYFVLPRIVNI